MHKQRVLAADVGGTNIRAALVDTLGSMSDERRIQANLSRDDVDETQLLNVLADFFQTYLNDVPDIHAIGLGFPGFFSGDSGLLLSSPNLPQLHHVDLAAKLSSRLSLPVLVQNDALCAALGEQRFGAGKGKSNLLHITLGTGVGGGLILQNHPYSGETGMAMEFGHLHVQTGQHARHCACGGQGCVEAYASSTSMQAMYEERTHENLTSHAIYERACDGDDVAKAVLEEAGTRLGQAIAEAVKLLDVHTVTISGGVLGAWDAWQPSLMTSLNHHLIPPLKGKIQVLPSILKDASGILGAAAMAWAACD